MIVSWLASSLSADGVLLLTQNHSDLAQEALTSFLAFALFACLVHLGYVFLLTVRALEANLILTLMV